jgi:Mrp family chromosome partitioning ATPase
VVRLQGVPSTWSPDPELTPEAQRGLCEQLYPFAVEACFVLAVVAVPESGNYKSRVAAELALALAQSGHPRVLLMEADFHRPCVQRTLCVDMPMGAGFSQQLRERIIRGNRGRWTVIAPQPSLHVLAEGMMRTPGLLLTRQFAEGLKELRSYYDLIIIDGPTSSLDVDSKALDSVIDGLVTVCPAKGSPALAQMQSMFSQKRFSAYVTAL